MSYKIGDARNLSEYVGNAQIACVDLAWARPNRNGVYVTYPTYAPDNGLWDFVDSVYNVLEPGGWAFFDADDWLLPRLIQHLQEHWGDVASTYNGGGYRRTGTVVYDGHPGGGHYFTNGGYHVVFAHKGETDRVTSTSAKITTQRVPREIRSQVEWGTLKPIEPYKQWIGSIRKPDDTVVIPCAGTAPAALAAEELGIEWVAVDSEAKAKDAYELRKQLQAPSTQQTL